MESIKSGIDLVEVVSIFDSFIKDSINNSNFQSRELNFVRDNIVVVVLQTARGYFLYSRKFLPGVCYAL